MQEPQGSKMVASPKGDKLVKIKVLETIWYGDTYHKPDAEVLVSQEDAEMFCKAFEAGYRSSGYVGKDDKVFRRRAEIVK
jgi:hypothetical protein